MTVRLKSYCNSVIGNVIKSSVRPSMQFSAMKDLRAVFSSAGRGGSVVVLRARPVGRNCSGQHCETLGIIVWDRLGHRVKRCEVTDCALLWFGPPPFIIFFRELKLKPFQFEQKWAGTHAS